MWLLGVAGALFVVLYLFTASFPETSSDGASYHLGYLARYVAAGHIYKVETSFYPMLSQGFEMLYLPALLFGGDSACALLHTLFVSVMMALFPALGELVPAKKTELAAAALIFYATPIVGFTATTGYIDAAAATVCLAAVYFTLLACRRRETADFIFAGICCSFALSIKISTAPILLLCLLLLLLKARPAWKQLGAFLLASTVVEVTWLSRNWIWYGNPIVPMGNALFPNPYVHADFEAGFRQYLAHYEGLSLSPSLFLETTVRGFLSQGVIGPIYLLFPLAVIVLVAKKQYIWPAATVVMLAVYPMNLGTRFLQPALPFAALAIAAGIAARTPRLIVPAAILAAVTTWPSVVNLYVQPYAQRLRAPTLATIFHRPSRSAWLKQRLGDYRMIQYLNAHVSPDAQVLSQSGLPILYVRPTIRVWYESAENERLRDVLVVGLQPETHAPAQLQLTPTAAITATQFQLRPEQVSPDAQWSVSEVKLRTDEAAAPTSICVPNPFDCSLIQDGNPVTLWRNWEPLPAAAHIDLNFGQPVTLSAVEIACPKAALRSGFRLEGCRDSDCRPVPTVTEIREPDLNRAGEFLIRELRRVRVEYVLIEDAGLNASMEKLVSAGLFKELFADGGSKLFQIAAQ